MTTLKTPIYSPADRLVRPQGDSHGRSHCRGELGRLVCAERSTCALHLRQLKEPKTTAMTLPRVGGSVGDRAMSYSIVRRAYSVDPWRLVDGDGREVEAPRHIEHPVIGWCSLMMPVSGATRRECEAAALALLPLLAAQRDDARAARDRLASKLAASLEAKLAELQGGGKR